MKLKSIFSSIQRFSLLDYDKHISMIFFTKGCNFRCPYCHNPDLVIGKNIPFLDVDEIKKLLEQRKKVIDGIVICGGEPTLHKNLIEWIKYIKSLGYKVKLDTNATNPTMIKELINNKLIDFFAIDYKAPLKKYSSVTKMPFNEKDFLVSLKYIINSKIEYELRTTVHASLLTKEDIKTMINELKKIGVKSYYLQRYIKAKNTLENLGEIPQTKQIIEESLFELKNNFKNYGVRNL